MFIQALDQVHILPYKRVFGAFHIQANTFASFCDPTFYLSANAVPRRVPCYFVYKVSHFMNIHCRHTQTYGCKTIRTTDITLHKIRNYFHLCFAIHSPHRNMFQAKVAYLYKNVYFTESRMVLGPTSLLSSGYQGLFPCG